MNLRFDGMLKMLSRLPGCYDFRGCDLSIGSDLALSSDRIYEGFAKPSWVTIKRHLFRTHIPKKSLKDVREIPPIDKKYEFKKG